MSDWHERVKRLPISHYATVQVSPRRWMVVNVSGRSISGAASLWTPGVRAETPPLSYEAASMALREFQEQEALERERKAKDIAEHRARRPSPYDSDPGKLCHCPVCHDEKPEGGAL